MKGNGEMFKRDILNIFIEKKDGQDSLYVSVNDYEGETWLSRRDVKELRDALTDALHTWKEPTNG